MTSIKFDHQHQPSLSLTRHARAAGSNHVSPLRNGARGLAPLAGLKRIYMVNVKSHNSYAPCGWERGSGQKRLSLSVCRVWEFGI